MAVHMARLPNRPRQTPSSPKTRTHTSTPRISRQLCFRHLHAAYTISSRALLQIRIHSSKAMHQIRLMQPVHHGDHASRSDQFHARIIMQPSVLHKEGDCIAIRIRYILKYGRPHGHQRAAGSISIQFNSIRFYICTCSQPGPTPKAIVEHVERM